jgi:hypothetical protein
MLYIGNCILQSGMWITHIYIIFYRKIFNHDKIPRTETVPMREMLENVRWGKNELKSNGMGGDVYVRNRKNAILSKIRTFSVALLHWAYLPRYTCNLWVGGGHKNAKMQNAGLDWWWRFIFCCVYASVLLLACCICTFWLDNIKQSLHIERYMYKSLYAHDAFVGNFYFSISRQKSAFQRDEKLYMEKVWWWMHNMHILHVEFEIFFEKRVHWVWVFDHYIYPSCSAFIASC